MADLWFKIGSNPGYRFVKEQLTGLDKLQTWCQRASILDLGCAEGLIGKYYVDSVGADLLHGIESVPERVAEAQRQCAQYEVDGQKYVEFFCADLNDAAALAELPLRPRYDVVLALAILHKLKDPVGMLRWAAARCDQTLVVRMPGSEDSFSDKRSGGVVVEPAKILAGEWDLVIDRAGPRGERNLIFRRLTAPQSETQPCEKPTA